MSSYSPCGGQWASEQVSGHISREGKEVEQSNLKIHTSEYVERSPDTLSGDQRSKEPGSYAVHSSPVPPATPTPFSACSVSQEAGL